MFLVTRGFHERQVTGWVMLCLSFLMLLCVAIIDEWWEIDYLHKELCEVVTKQYCTIRAVCGLYTLNLRARHEVIYDPLEPLRSKEADRIALLILLNAHPAMWLLGMAAGIFFLQFPIFIVGKVLTEGESRKKIAEFSFRLLSVLAVVSSVLISIALTWQTLMVIPLYKQLVWEMVRDEFGLQVQETDGILKTNFKFGYLGCGFAILFNLAAALLLWSMSIHGFASQGARSELEFDRIEYAAVKMITADELPSGKRLLAERSQRCRSEEMKLLDRGQLPPLHEGDDEEDAFPVLRWYSNKSDQRRRQRKDSESEVGAIGRVKQFFFGRLGSREQSGSANRFTDQSHHSTAQECYRGPE